MGSFENRKGQDIFCKAIRLLPPETMKKASFLFVGKAAEAEMMDAVRSLTADCPDNVFYVKRLTRDEIKSLMAQCTCLVCASRDDPMPTFVTEGLIFGKPAIVSEHTGTAGLITEGVDGFVYEDDDPEKLAERLAWAIEHPEKLAAMRPACRELYESHYSKQAFSDSLRPVSYTHLVKPFSSGNSGFALPCRTGQGASDGSRWSSFFSHTGFWK